jgi:hypothetical protein
MAREAVGYVTIITTSSLQVNLLDISNVFPTRTTNLSEPLALLYQHAYVAITRNILILQYVKVLY